MEAVIVTGCAGFIGMHVSVSLLQQGYSVIGIDNLNNYYDVKLKEDRLSRIHDVALDSGDAKWTFFKNDLNDERLWKRLAAFSINGIIHLAAQAGVRFSLSHPREYLASNINGFQSVLEFCVTQKVKRLIYASSSSVYGKDSEQPFCETEDCNSPESYYAATKKMNELMAGVYFRTHGICSIGLRFFTVYGPWGRPDMAPMIFAKAAQNGEEIRLFNLGEQKRDFTYIDDIVNGINLIYNSRNVFSSAEIVNIGNGNPESLMNFVNLLEKWIEKPLMYRLEDAQIGDVDETFASLKKLRDLVGYRPQTNLDEGLRNFVLWYKTYYQKP